MAIMQYIHQWGGGFFAPFVHVDRGGVCRMSTLVHLRGEGVKIGSKLVHVVVECPLTGLSQVIYRSHNEGI